MDWPAMLEAIRADPRYRKNVQWGRPREGHPEGTIAAHIDELERNLSALRPRLSEEEYAKLRILVHVHDTFKSEAIENIRITDPRSHASLARAFLAEYCDDADLQAMVQFHDEPYALYQQWRQRGTSGGERPNALLSAIRDWDLFTAFLIVDGCTAGKSREPLRWFFAEIAGRITTRWTEEDVL